METEERIREIIAVNYHNYNGRYLQSIKALHELLIDVYYRQARGEIPIWKRIFRPRETLEKVNIRAKELFLEKLEELIKANPHPIYQS